MSDFDVRGRMEYGTQGAGEQDVQSVKTCPMCGAKLFSDMDVCYGCLYNFSDADNGAQEFGMDTSDDNDEIWGSIDELWDKSIRATPLEPLVQTAPQQSLVCEPQPFKTIRLKMGEVLEIQISA